MYAVQTPRRVCVASNLICLDLANTGFQAIPEGGGAGAGAGATLTFACYIHMGSLATLIFNPQNNNYFWYIPKNTCQCHITPKILRLFIATNGVDKK